MSWFLKGQPIHAILVTSSGWKDDHHTRNSPRGLYGLRGSSHRYLLRMGSKNLLIYARSLDDALEEAIEWCAEHSPGTLCDDEVAEAYQDALDDGMSDEQAMEIANQDVYNGDHGHSIASESWGIYHEDPTRAQMLEFLGDNHVSVRKQRRAYYVCNEHTECISIPEIGHECSRIKRGLPPERLPSVPKIKIDLERIDVAIASITWAEWELRMYKSERPDSEGTEPAH